MSFLSQPITLQALFRKDRTFGPITIQVILNEQTSDILTITKQPVQQGASITDHAYKEPTQLSMQMLFEDNILISLSKIYQELLDLQVSRVPMDVVTPKRVYSNMLIASISLVTDVKTENILSISMVFQEVIIVQVVTTQVPRIRQKNPGATGATQNAGKKSALRSLKDGVGVLVR